jgi:peptide/nickel transport system substrate-binding protein
MPAGNPPPGAWQRLLDDVTGEPMEHAVDPGVLGEYAVILDASGADAARRTFPQVAAHLDSGCETCSADLAELVTFARAERIRLQPRPKPRFGWRGISALGLAVVALGAASLLTIRSPLSPIAPNASVRPAPTDVAVATAPGTPVRGGSLALAMPSGVTNLDPLRSDAYSGAVLGNVADSLFEVDLEGNIVGALVASYETPQPNVYVLHLRLGVKFHDGTDFNAQAVVFNLRRALNDANSGVRQYVANITSMQTPDSATVRLTLATPDAAFLSHLVSGAGYMLSPAAVTNLGSKISVDLTGAGTGPFRFSSMKQDGTVVLDRNPNYWRTDPNGTRLPYLDQLVFIPTQIATDAVLDGTADVLIGPPLASESTKIATNPDVRTTEVPGLGFQAIFLNTQKPPFDDPLARRALSAAIDRQQIRDEFYQGTGLALDTPVPKVLAWAYPQTAPYLAPDLALARQALVATVDKKTGFSFTLQIPSNSLAPLAFEDLVQHQVADLNIQIQAQNVDFNTLLTNASKGDFQALNLGWSGSTDPDGDLRTFVYSSSPTNYSRYNNSAVDALLDQARATSDQSARGAAYQQVQQMLYADQPLIVFYNPPQIQLSRKTIQNLSNSYNGYFGVRDLYKVWKLPD